MKFRKYTKAKGIKGELKSPEDFVVKELIEKKFLKRFTRTENGVQRTRGPYTLFLMKKINLNTEDAIKIIAKEFDIKEDDIGYAGLKDRNAITYQYITIKSEKIRNKIVEIECIELKKCGFTDKRISIGDLVANEFEITLHDCKCLKNIENIINELLERGMPNYFGPQRFGNREDNHIIGRYLIKRDFKKVNTKDKNRLKFFIHAYQSWLFNKTIESYAEKNEKMTSSNVGIFGYNTKLGSSKFDRVLKDLVKKEGIKQKDFMIDELKIRCDGGNRKAFIKLIGISYKIQGNVVKLNFTLPKGSYATVLLNEIKG